MRRRLADAVPLCERYGSGSGCSSTTGITSLTRSVSARSSKASTAVGWVRSGTRPDDARPGSPPESGLDIVWDRLLMVNLKNAFYVRPTGQRLRSAERSRHFTSGPQGMASWPRVAAELRRRALPRCRMPDGRVHR